jgi:ATP-dependent Clp protease ATP-binding subunit ClpB
VFNVLLQVLDDGRITDSQGRTVDFKNTIIILTSNIGSDIMLGGIEGEDISQDARSQVDMLVKRSFRPEFINRLDEIVYYKPLSRENINAIVDLLLADLSRRLAEKQLSVEVTESAKRYIVDCGYDPVYGARPLKRYLQSNVETLIARKIIGGGVRAGGTITVDYDGKGLTV